LLGALGGPAGIAAGALGGGALGANVGGNVGKAWGDSQVANAENAADKQRRKAMEQEALMQAIMSLRGI
jgi:hypothetical protein